MLIKTLLKIAEHLEMDVDKLSVRTVEHYDKRTIFYFDDNTTLYSIRLDENLNEATPKLSGTITNLNDNTKMDLLVSLLEWNII